MALTQRWTFGRYLAGAGAVLAVVFTALDPSGSEGLGGPLRLGFWLAHTYGALACLALATLGLARVEALRRRPWALALASGLVGSVLFAPAALSLESLLGMPEDFDGSGGGALARLGWVGEVVVEWTELVLPLSAAWLGLQVPWLLRLDLATAAAPWDPPEPATGPPSSSEVEPSSGSATKAPASAAEASPARREAPAPIETPEPVGWTEPEPIREVPAGGGDPGEGGLFAALPSALGRDLVALSSELHYLRVRTPRGEALVLYSLKNAEAEMESAGVSGLRVHRSHWVAQGHVRRLRRGGRGYVCEMTGGLKVPVSRRRQGDALATFGTGARYGG